MKFKPGDRVICINVDDIGDNNYLFGDDPILNKQYIICDILTGNNLVSIDCNDSFYYGADRFILDKNYYRKEKLKEIKK